MGVIWSVAPKSKIQESRGSILNEFSTDDCNCKNFAKNKGHTRVSD